MANTNGNGNKGNNGQRKTIAHVQGGNLKFAVGALTSAKVKYDRDTGDPFIVTYLGGYPTYINDAALVKWLKPLIDGVNEDVAVQSVTDAWNAQADKGMMTILVTKRSEDGRSVHRNLTLGQEIVIEPKTQREAEAEAAQPE